MGRLDGRAAWLGTGRHRLAVASAPTKKGLGPQVEGSLLALAGCVPADKHAAEMTVARLRRALGPAAAVIQTVVKRGHRLDVQHGAEWSAEAAPATVARCLP